jgi:hypothetical protein
MKRVIFKIDYKTFRHFMKVKDNAGKSKRSKANHSKFQMH